MRSIVFSFFLIFCCSGYYAEAQAVFKDQLSKKEFKEYDKARALFKSKDYQSSLETCEKLLSKQPEFVDGLLLLADNLRQLGNSEQAVSNLEKSLELAPDHRRAAWYLLADIHLKNEDFERAIVPLENYLQRCGDRQKPDIEKLLRNTRFAAEAVQKPVAFDPINLGAQINSAFSEYLPSFTIDENEIIFTRRLQGINEDFFSSQRLNDSWSQAINLGAPLNSPENEGAHFLSADGNTLLLTLCNRESAYGSCDIYISFRTEDAWSPPQNLGQAINTEWWDAQPCLSADGQSLYFVSNRPGGLGKSDIWLSRKDATGRWQKAENLGPTINTADKEQSPYLHPDGSSLYFSSFGHPGMGDADLYLSRRKPGDNKNIVWEQPINLGYPINTPSHEGALAVAANGVTAYFASDREDGFGELDLYHFELPDNLQAQPVSWIELILKDAITKSPLEASVLLENLAQNERVKSSSDAHGSLLLSLPPSGEYSFRIEKENYLFWSMHFDLSEASNADRSEPYRIEVNLWPLTEGSEVVLRNVFFASNSAELDRKSGLELNRVYSLLKENRETKIEIGGHTDDVGSEEDNLVLSQKRADAVKSFLVNKGISAERIRTKGYGESQPVSKEQNPEARALNRRTTLKILAK
jgi:outer membrane protein OmpA-like peptidoglycan-associated protein/Tfp pilus assembly protein PilF